MYFLLILALLISLPLAEIYCIIQVGRVLGALPTILLLVVISLAGTALLRWQGIATVRRVQLMLSQGRLPAVEVIEGLLLVLAAVLMITPGFLTDVAGLLLLLPPLRGLAAALILRQALKHGRFAVHGVDTTIIEGEFRRDDQPRLPPDRR
ncbi:MAG: FxsA family protein [Gammaproteobacteria bacterium]|nr:FxsA family protein [Gammaproteobacteria bacterium]